MDTIAVKKAYKRYSPIYNLVFKACFQPGREAAVEIINRELIPNSKILEVGVGTGLSLPLYEPQFSLTGIDVSGEMLAKARKLVEQKKLDNVVALQEMDVECLSYADHSFDAIVAMYVVSVVPNLERCIAEMHRVCRPGGDIMIVNHFASSNKLLQKMERRLAKISRLVGFNANFSIEPLLDSPYLKLIKRHKTNMFGYWTLLHFKNVG